MNEHLLWYIARASGVVAWALAVASVLWGLGVSGRFTRRRPSPAWVLDLHRGLGGLTVAFTGIHVAALVADSYVHFGPVELLVPLASRWKPGAVAWGILGLYALIAIEATSLAMRRLPRRLWRGVHMASFFVAVSATVHGLSAGTDAQQPTVRWGIGISVGLFTTALIVRLFLPGLRRTERRSRIPGPSTV